jgi:hypothetical protein
VTGATVFVAVDTTGATVRVRGASTWGTVDVTWATTPVIGASAFVGDTAGAVLVAGAVGLVAVLVTEASVLIPVDTGEVAASVAGTGVLGAVCPVGASVVVTGARVFVAADTTGATAPPTEVGLVTAGVDGEGDLVGDAAWAAVSADGFAAGGADG